MDTLNLDSPATHGHWKLTPEQLDKSWGLVMAYQQRGLLLKDRSPTLKNYIELDSYI